MLKPLLSLLMCCFFWGLSAQDSDCSFGLLLESTEASVGNEITLDLTVRQYNDIVAMQYSHQWNPLHLEFIEVLYNNALTITASDFNFTPEFLNQGILNFAHVEASVQGVSLPDNEVLYSLRFEVLDASGTTIELLPLGQSIEIVDDEQNVHENFYVVHGRVGEETSYPSLTSACVLPQACDNPELGQINIAPNGAGEFSVSWSSANGFSGTGQSISGLSSTRYDMTLTDVNGSSVSGDFYVGSQVDLNVSLSVDGDLCGDPADGSVSSTVSGGSGNYTYAWSDGSTSANLNDVPAGTYTLTVTDADLNCSVSATATVESSSGLIGFFTSTDPSCQESADGSTTINVEGPPEAFPVTYLWSNGATDATIQDLNEGLYTVTVTDATGCDAVFFELLTGGTFTFDAEIVHPTCELDAGSISVQLNPADYSFNWNNGGTSAVIDNLGVGSYTVTVTDNTTGCSNVETYELVAEDIIAAWNYECFQIDGQDMSDITAAVWNPNDGPYQFSWSNGVLETAEMFSSITVPAGGTYELTITSASGCEEVLTDISPTCDNTDFELYLTPAESSLEDGETRCFTVRANNFEQIIAAQFSLTWDDSKLAFEELGTLSLPGLTTSNFGTQLTDDGVLTFSWLDFNVSGVSIADGSPLFEVCLSGATAAETTVIIDFSGFPTPIEVVAFGDEILQVATADALVNLNDGNGNNGSGSVSLLAGNAAVSTADEFCVSIAANDFVDVIGMQGTISWDADALQLTGVSNYNLPNLNDSNFGELAEAQLDGRLRFLWSDLNLQGVTVADGASLFDMCFIATGGEGSYPIAFVDEPLPLEFIDSDLDNLEVTGESGLITITEGTGNNDGEVSLVIASTAAGPGELVCVPVSAVQFSEIVGMQFSLDWDESRISFTELNLVDNDLQLNASYFNLNNTSAGTLSFSWISSQLDPVSLSVGEALFELCYTTQAIPGPAGIQFSSSPTAIEFIRDNMTVPFIPLNGTITVTEENLVWPGDTNDDGVANNLDILPIGLGYTATGADRINPSIAWLPQYAPEWAGSTPISSVNFRHADADGNGTIDAVDTLALSQNWGQTADAFTDNEPVEGFQTGAPMYILADTLQAGIQVRLPIMLGTEEALENAYGLAFTISYDPETVENGSIHIEANGWLLGSADEHLLMYHDFPSEGRVEVGMVRRDAQGVTGAGQIAEFVIIMEDVILRNLIDVETYFKIENVKLITAQEIDIPTSPRETTVLVQGVTTDTDLLDPSLIQISPNPTSSIVRINSGDFQVQQLELVDANGRVLWSEQNPELELDLSGYPAGVYYLHVNTTSGSLYEKIIKL